MQQWNYIWWKQHPSKIVSTRCKKDIDDWNSALYDRIYCQDLLWSGLTWCPRRSSTHSGVYLMVISSWSLKPFFWVWSQFLSINIIFVYRSHEWLKHGTCTDMQTENEYFSTVLKIFESGLNFGDILEKGGIRPSSTDTYKVSTHH